MRNNFLLIFLFFLLLPPKVSPQDNLVQLKTAVHLSSVISEGDHALSQIAAIAQGSGISVVIFNDRDLMRWEYGLWPLRGVIKKTVEHNSIFKHGIGSYLKQIAELQNTFPEMVFMPGAESAPFYYWEGSPFKTISIKRKRLGYQGGGVDKSLQGLRNKLILEREGRRAPRLLEDGHLRMYNWHQHILTIGMEGSNDYANIPIVGNPSGLDDGFNVIGLWPLLTLILGLGYARKRIYFYTDFNGRHMDDYSKKWQAIAVLLIITSSVFILNNWPFSSFKFDQYHNDLENIPYQNFIDYVNERGGLTFWAHPEAGYILNMGSVGFITREYAHRLLDTKDYTGFSIFPEGYQQVGRPGGIWDDLLIEYCKGVRKKPVWAIGGLAFEKGDLSRDMKHLQTIVLAPEKSKQAVLDALRKGKIYVARGRNSLNFKLSQFSLSDELKSIKGFVGDVVKIEGRPVLYIEGQFLEEQREIEVSIIKEGKIVKSYKMKTPFTLTYHEDSTLEEKSYYRLEIKGKHLHLITNPIFVHQQNNTIPAYALGVKPLR